MVSGGPCCWKGEGRRGVDLYCPCAFRVLMLAKPRESEEALWSPALPALPSLQFADRLCIIPCQRNFFRKCFCLVFPVRYRHGIALRGLGWGCICTHVCTHLCLSMGKAASSFPALICLCMDLASADTGSASSFSARGG